MNWPCCLAIKVYPTLLRFLSSIFSVRQRNIRSGTNNVPIAANEINRALHLQSALLIISGIIDRKSTRLNSSHVKISYAVFCLKKKHNRSMRLSPLRRLHHKRVTTKIWARQRQQQLLLPPLERRGQWRLDAASCQRPYQSFIRM